MYGILVLCMEYYLYGILVSCMGFEFYASGKNKNHMSPGCNYGGVYCLMYGILVLCLRYVSYVWDISFMSGIFVLCMAYLSYVWDMFGILLLRIGY